MDGVSADQEHRFQSAHQLYLRKSFRNLDIPPRKLLPRRLDMNHHHPLLHSPSHPQDTLCHNFPADSDDDPYASDEFRMYQFKIRKCTRSRSHDWTDCPFAHPGEKARRRCPRRFGYTGIMCIDFRRGCCVRGDTCEFAHGVFEYWLHPSRYRTEACKDGRLCQRKICFFAHTSTQLRSLSPADMVVWPNKHGSGHCASCRCHSHHTPSPTSILNVGGVLSPPTTPPISLAQPGCASARVSPISRFSSGGMAQHNEVMTSQATQGLMHNMQAMNMNASDHDHVPKLNPFLTRSLAARNDDDQSFFSFSPSTSFPCASGSSGITPGEYNFMNNLNEGGFVKEMTAISNGEDFKWVNDLFT